MTIDADQPTDDHAEPVAVGVFATEGEAEVAVAALRASGIDAALDDQVEGGSVPIDGEDGVIVAVRAADADTARAILAPAATVGDTVSDA